MRAFLQRWAKAEGGVTALIFAVCSVMLIMMVGSGVDLSRQAYLRSRLSDAVDAAALGLVGKTSREYVEASQMLVDGSLPNAQSDAKAVFDATMAGMQDVTVAPGNFTVVATKTGPNVTATVTATATIPTYFMGIAGVQTMSVTSQSGVANTLPSYIDFYLLLDNTPSMSIAATQAGIDKLSSLNPEGCGFACHDQSGAEDYYSIAVENNIATRINIIAQATSALVSYAKTTETLPNQYRMAIATYGASMSSIGYTRMPAGTGATAPPSTDLDGQATVANSIDAMQVPYQNFNSDEATDFYKVMADAAVDVPPSGNGSSSLQSQKVLFIVTDGVNDSNHGGRLIAPIDTKLCDAIKSQKIQIAVLYMTYIPLNNSFYLDNVSKYQPPPFATSTYKSPPPTIGPPYPGGVPPYKPNDGTIPGQLEGCASSPQLFEEVALGGDLTGPMQTLFIRATESARILN